MRFRVLACDYDNTIASHGVVAPATMEALERVRATGRCLLLVTGRTRAELEDVLPGFGPFDRIVAENGALLIDPEDGEETLLSDQIPERFVAELRRRGVTPLSVGRGICATWYPHHATVVEAIHDLGLDLRVTFNKGSVMVLPSEVTKATGTRAALKALGQDARSMIAVGDAENDLVFLGMAGCGVAVANALDSVKARADLVLERPDGEGIVELVDALLDDELAGRLSEARRRAG
jgi:hydroxymethylpyrimidine pyrophosphatase-like HAD family hydrolase